MTRLRGRRSPVVPRPGDVVVDGNIRARLLGLRLLELDAHVVVGRATGPERRRPAPIDGAARTSAAVPAYEHDALPLARAQRLLDEGSSVLEGARRIR